MTVLIPSKEEIDAIISTRKELDRSLCLKRWEKEYNRFEKDITNIANNIGNKMRENATSGNFTSNVFQMYCGDYNTTNNEECAYIIFKLVNIIRSAKYSVNTCFYPPIKTKMKTFFEKMFGKKIEENNFKKGMWVILVYNIQEEFEHGVFNSFGSQHFSDEMGKMKSYLTN